VARPTEEPGEAELPLPAIPEGHAFRISLPSFEGPLDLLLHLTREHQIDLRDIPIAFITERYLEYLDLMKSLNLDVVSEFLLMAATLVQLKSRLLLPPSEQPAEGGEEEVAGDPREELVRRLLEYQKYRDAAEQLGRRAILGRDVFARSSAPPEGSNEPELAEVSVFKLLEAFDRVLKSRKIHSIEEIQPDRISLGEAIAEIARRLGAGKNLPFEDLFAVEDGQAIGRHRLVVTFLAVLEMTRLRLIRVVQESEQSSLLLIGTEALLGPIEAMVDEGGYGD
jgi:segregation and condensation protein A